MENGNNQLPPDKQTANLSAAHTQNAALWQHETIALVAKHSPYLSKLIEFEEDFCADIATLGFDVSLSRVIGNLECTEIKELSKKDLMMLLRLAKRKISLLVALADISGTWNLEKITRALSDFADLAVKCAVEFLLHERFTQKMVSDADAASSGLVILAVGKLGAYELNYSSDIDIVVLYDGTGNKYTGKLSPREFFVRLAQELVEILESRNEYGYVFRTDLRIRPDPFSTPLAVSIESAMNYYKTVGQNWERAALIKARPVAGDMAAAKRFTDFIKTFIWRDNLDFNAIQDIKSVKRQIDSSHPSKPEKLEGYNIKLGKGGIREIEFYAQTQQLLWGGRDEGLRHKATCDALRVLEAEGKIKPGVAVTLIKAYELLRKIEHRLQMIHDDHTHSLPVGREELKRFADFMGYKKPEDFENELAGVLAVVQQEYAKLFEESTSLSAGGNLVFTGVTNDPETLITLSKIGFKEPERVAEVIRGWHHGRRESTAHQRVREILTELVPYILKSFGGSNNPDEALVKFDDFLAQIPSAVMLFELFNEKREIIDVMAEVMGNSPWLAANFSRSPWLASQILVSDFSANFPPLAELGQNLVAALSRENNIDEKLKIIRRWKHDKEFVAGIRLLKNIISHEQAGHDLSAIADVVVKQIYEIFKENSHMVIIALGKLGARELTFDSDLDLVFVHEGDSFSHERIAKKILAPIGEFSADGALYNVDTRLRPMGEQGGLSSSIEAYTRYYTESAWNWELMALVKARVIAGNPALTAKVEKVIAEVIAKPKDEKKLAADMFEMRQKIATQHSMNDIWNIKYAKGGIFEAEFIIQYEILTGKKVKSESFVNAYEFLKKVQSAIRLTTLDGFDESAATGTHKATLARSAREKNFSALKERLIMAEGVVASAFEHIFKN